MPNDNQRLDVAVFIDFENVYVSVRDKLDANPNFEMIMDRCNDLGRVVISRAYADWYRYPRITSALYANGIEPMYVPTYYYDRDLGRTGRAIKNSVDMNLCIDAMKTLFTNPNIGKFVLATGDRDFIPLVNSIRQQGKEVIIIGVGGAASAHLAQSADEFIFYEQLVGKSPLSLQQDQPRVKMPEKGREQDLDVESPPVVAPVAPPAPAPIPIAAPVRERETPREKEPLSPDVYDVLVRAVHLARERDFVCSFGSLKLLMKELMGGEFKEGRYRDSAGRPFAKFKDFVLEAERREKIQVFTSGAVNEVFLPGEDPYKLSQFAQDLKEEPVLPERDVPIQELRVEPRSPSPSNGRRRRRRSRGQRQPGAPITDLSMLDEQSEDLEELDEQELALPDLPELALDGDTADDTMFDTLLERIEAEEARGQQLEILDPLQILDPPIGPAVTYEAPVMLELSPVAEEPQATIELSPVAEEPQATIELSPVAEESSEEPQATTAASPSQPFTEAEWQLLADLIARQDRAISFVQIHDLLRNSRNSAGITRTNEELRTMIKQAINTGMLARSGKGNRITYRLAARTGDSAMDTQVMDPPVAEEEPAPDMLSLVSESEQPASISEEPQPSAAPVDSATGAPDLTSQVAATEQPTPEEPTAPARRSRSRRKPAAATAAPEAPPVEIPPPAEPEAPARPRRRRKKADTTPEAE